jgi:hypothetical protein
MAAAPAAVVDPLAADQAAEPVAVLDQAGVDRAVAAAEVRETAGATAAGTEAGGVEVDFSADTILAAQDSILTGPFGR